MRIRQPFSVLRSETQRATRARYNTQRHLRRMFDGVEVIIMLLPPYVMARVPLSRFDPDTLSQFVLRRPANHDLPLPSAPEDAS